MAGRLREIALWTGAVLGLLSMIVAIAVFFLGFSFLVFRSGSMGPEIPTGSLALARTTSAAELEAGDVVSVIAANGERITHRLVRSTLRGDEASLVLKGDANSLADAEVYVVREAEREIASVPYAGYVVTVLLSPAGLVAVGCLSGMLLLLGFGRPEDGSGSSMPTTGGRHRGSATRGRRTLVGSAVGLSLLAAAGVGVTGTAAAFNDRASVTGTFSMAVPNPATNVRCVPGLLNANAIIRWDAPIGPAPTGYRLNYVSNAASGFIQVGAGVTEARPPVPDANGNRTYTVTVTALYGALLSPVSATSSTILGRNSALFPWSC